MVPGLPVSTRMAHFLADVRFAVRSLRKVPLFTSVAVLSIAFGITANTAVFTLVDQVLLRTLPVDRPSELVQVDAEGTESHGGGMGDGTELSYAMYKDLRDRNDVFAGMLCRFSVTLQVSGAGGNDRVLGEMVSGTYFPVLGVTPAVGRLLTVEDDARARGVAVLGYGYWQSRFHGDPGVVGRALTVNGHPYEIVGVVRPSFNGIDIARPPAVYLPIEMQPQVGPPWLKLDGRRFRWVQVFGRLRPQVTAVQAQARLIPLYRTLLEQEAAAPGFGRVSAEARQQFLGGALHVTSAAHGHSGLRQRVTEPLLILMSVAVGVLLIVCANVANLLIARGAGRQRELALRLAVGASRWQLVRLLLVESLVLAVIGTALGLLFASWGAAALLHYYDSPETPMAIASDPDLRIALFSGGLAVVTAMLAGCVPALRSTRVDVAPALRSAGGAVASEQPRLRNALVVVQVALSFLLLIGAGLFVRSVNNLLAVDTGFRTSHLLSFSVDLAGSGYDTDRSHDFAKAAQARLANTAGVAAAASTFIGVLEGDGWGMEVTVEGYHPEKDEAAAMCNAVSPGFFRAMGVPVLLGREFDGQDDRVEPRPEPWPFTVAVVNETFVKRFFGGQNPIGRHLGLGSDPGTPMPARIVGVVKDTRYGAVRERIRPQVFFPNLQSGIEGLTIYVRTDRTPEDAMRAIRQQIASLDPSLALFNVSTVDDRITRSVVNERLIASLSATLSGMATLLAVIGLYGVLAYSVTRRTREIGIRMALGALGSQIASRVLLEAAALVAIGLLLGGGAAAWLGRFVENQLYGVKPADALTVAVAAASLAVVAALAALLPARRASTISPMMALRDQ
jgi:predicted permease